MAKSGHFLNIFFLLFNNLHFSPNYFAFFAQKPSNFQKMYYSISEGSVFCTMRAKAVMGALKGVSLDIEKLTLKTTGILQTTFTVRVPLHRI